MKTDRAILLDVDQTLVTQEQPFTSAVSAVMGLLGQAITNPGKAEFNAALISEMIGTPEFVLQTAPSKRDLLWMKVDRHGHDESAIAGWVEKVKFGVWSSILDKGQAASAAKLFTEHIPRAIAPMPGASDALKLASRHSTVIAVTNGFASHQRRKLELTGLIGYLDGIATSAEAKAAKPSPEPFLMGLKLAGVDPATAVMIGDSFPNDIVGASNLGIRTIKVPGECQKHAEHSNTITATSVLEAVNIALKF
jgi:FMN phosphatase YigB (HAD superfamily)